MVFGRLFSSSRPNANNSNRDGSESSTLENNSQVEENERRRGDEPTDPQPSVDPPASEIPDTPLVTTDKGKTVVRLFVEILGCDNLGPDFLPDGTRNTEVYNPYVKVKLGGSDDKDALDIHKTKPVQQRFNYREPIFDHEHHHSGFVIDGMEMDELAKGLMFKVKNAAATSSQKKAKQDVLGWSLVQADVLLWKHAGAGMLDESNTSCIYQDELNNTLEFELVHPTELVTGLAGKIHIMCRPATDAEVEECRNKGWGFFKYYTPADDRASAEQAPPIRELM